MQKTYLIPLALFLCSIFISCNKDNKDNNFVTPPPPVDTTSNLLVYAAGQNGKLYAFNALDGSVNWTFTLSNPAGHGQLSSPVIADSTLYIGSTNKNVYAIDALTGKEKWHYTTNSANGTFYAAPLVADGKVFVGGNDTVFQAINAATGQLVWSRNFAREFQSAATFYNGTVYVCCSDGVLYALDANTGATRWTFGSDRYYFGNAAPKVKNGVLYALCGGTYFGGGFTSSLLFVQNPLNSQPIGSREGTYFHYNFTNWSCPTIVDSIAYVAGNDSCLYAVQTYYIVGSDTKKWKYKTGNGIVSSPAVDDSTVYVGSYEGIVHAVDRFTGNLKWKFSTIPYGVTKMSSSPAYANGVIYIGSGSGLFALDARTGAKKWVAQQGVFFDTSPCVVTKQGKVIHSGISGMPE